jgi:Shikimate kinase
MNKIYLVGYMGAGKSALAKRLAAKIGWSVIDLDVLFEERYCISISDFFEKYNESLFRKIESKILYSTKDMSNVVVATGGGTPCFNDNMDWMNQNGMTVFVYTSSESVAYRVKKSKKKRPLLKGLNDEELLDYIRKHYSERMPYYMKAQLTIKGENCKIDDLINLINI